MFIISPKDQSHSVFHTLLSSSLAPPPIIGFLLRSAFYWVGGGGTRAALWVVLLSCKIAMTWRNIVTFMGGVQLYAQAD